nr:MAG TPA: hypothetical protein [Caudoviricetes sp.]
MKESKVRLESARSAAPEYYGSRYEFARDLPYMKADIWAEGKAEEHDESANAEIYHVFGHDVATYPNQDNPQHFANVQFAGKVDNNKLHVMQDHEASRTAINHALRAVKENAEGRFARDGEYSRTALWTPEVEKQGVERTARGLRQDGAEILSREGSRTYGKVSRVEFEHDAGYLKSEIFGEKEVKAEPQPEAPKPVEPKPEPQPQPEPEAPKPCPEGKCEEGTLGNALSRADEAAAAIDKIIEPVAPATPAPVTPAPAEATETHAEETHAVDSAQ